MTGLGTGLAVDLRHGWAFAIKRRAKLLAYLLAAAAFVVANGLVHGQVAVYLNLGIAFAGALGVHQVPNAKRGKSAHRPSPHR